MSNISLILKQFSRSVLLIAGFAILGFSARAQGDAAKGEGIFKANCTACHKLDQKMTGPALGPVITADTDDKWLTKWIQNNKALIAAGDAKAVKVYNDNQQGNMTVFATLSDGDVANVLAYVRTEYKAMQEKAKAAPATAAAADSGPSNLVIFGLIAVIVIAFIVILLLNKVIGTLERLLLNKKGLAVEEVEVDDKAAARKAEFKKLLKNKKLVGFFIVCAVICGGSWQWVTLWNTNVHTGYQPVQPIKFPHDLHAGVMKIECQYCHAGAFKSKNATIPSLNVCMNCHKSVDRRMDASAPSTEIAKIYTALGYDPATTKYDSTKAKPVQWIRIHNLPDLAYFNHSQHTKVGGLKCQTCHGPVETMQEVYQYSPLTMKWCIQCHKRTEVNYKGNAYYDNMIQVHDKIKRGEKVTAAALGGIECGKCHY
ncbi:c-type cytochrome [Mucilaginibacter sp. HMF5004]|uniref:cytochrome c3 family protein n=1 Tax=Mucilaginibacter rivuli TaxID=2857527 RepID=UPI001C5D2C69|nr:cytochrome c3 family protein [Mucilaginibacter rivuli]MBW4890289.1 c-type cytochrome [Mucilaginibacter rivuli]